MGMVVALLAGANCAADEKDKARAAAKAPEKKAVAVLESKSGSHVTGKATFREADGKVTLNLEIDGAEPGTHAVHLHEKGDCSAPDGASAGGHWNPTHENHGKWGTAPFHRGDIGVIDVGADGKGILRSEERRVGKSVDLGGRRIIKKKNKRSTRR